MNVAVWTFHVAGEIPAGGNEPGDSATAVLNQSVVQANLIAKT